MAATAEPGQVRRPESKLIKIASIKTDHCHRKTLGDLESLAASIRAQGLLQPIGITENGELAFGLRRLRACQHHLEWTEIPATIVNVTSLVEAEHDENELRLAFSAMERVAVAKLVEAEIGRRQGMRTDKELPANGPEVAKGKETREIAAKKAGFSSTTQYRRAQVVHDKGIQELKDAVDEGKIKIAQAENIARLPKADQKRLIEDNGKVKYNADRKPTATIAREKSGNEFTGPAKEAAAEYESQALDAIRALTSLNRALLTLQNSTLNSGAWLNTKQLIAQVTNMRKQIKDAAPHSMCEDCRGHGCGKCHQCGFLNKGAFEKWSKS